jgi:hypothetical protein
VNRQCTFLSGSSAITFMLMLPIGSPLGERKPTWIVPPVLDTPVVALVHHPATPSIVASAAYTFATGALIPTR